MLFRSVYEKIPQTKEINNSLMNYKEHILNKLKSVILVCVFLLAHKSSNLSLN